MQSVKRYTDHFIPSWYWVLGDNFWNPLIPEDQYITYKKHLFLVAYWWFHVVWKPVWSTTIYSTSVKSFSQCRPSIFHLIFTLTFLLITIILKQEGVRAPHRVSGDHGHGLEGFLRVWLLSYAAVWAFRSRTLGFPFVEAEGGSGGEVRLSEVCVGSFSGASGRPCFKPQEPKS